MAGLEHSKTQIQIKPAVGMDQAFNTDIRVPTV